MFEQFNAAIDKLYAAAADPAQWDAAFAAIEQLADCAGIVVHLVGKDDMGDSLTLAGPRMQGHVTAAEVKEWEQQLLAQCPRLATGLTNPGAPYVCDYLIMTEGQMARNPVYEWYDRHDLPYFIGSTLGVTSRYRLMWSLQRTRSQGHVQAGDIHLFELLKPHVERALHLADELGTLRSHRRLTSEMMEALPQAIFALDAEGRMLFTNLRGTRLLADRDGLQLDDGQLKTSIASEQTRLDLLRRQSMAPGEVQTNGWMPVSRPSGQKSLAVFVAPVASPYGDFITPGVNALVVVNDFSRPQPTDPCTLISIYGLTDAEARLAGALGMGHSLESAAVLLGIQPSTGRAHLKSIFRKTSVNRQQDLVRLLTSLSAAPTPAKA